MTEKMGRNMAGQVTLTSVKGTSGGAASGRLAGQHALTGRDADAAVGQRGTTLVGHVGKLVM